jgi:uncharacterized protein YneF (UPF0154 family)
MRFRLCMSVVLGLTLLLLLGGCTKSVRYTQEELKEFPPDVQERIIKGEIMLGMSTKAVRYAWGDPRSIRVLPSWEGKSREEWIYASMGFIETHRLLFTDGKLTFIVPEPEKPAGQDTK